LTIEEIERLFHQITDRFTILPDAEVAIEIDPRVTTAEQIEKLRDVGFNRLSMGIQDFTPVVQAAIGRWQTLQQSEALYRTSRAYGFRGINMDLIYGLPNKPWSTLLIRLMKLFACILIASPSTAMLISLRSAPIRN